MTQEEIVKVKAMTVPERIRHFLPKLRGNLITENQYAALLRFGTVAQHQETSCVGSSHKEDQELQPVSVEIATTNESVQYDAEDPLSSLAREFGGYVVSESQNVECRRTSEKTNHPSHCTGRSQKQRLLEVLSDGNWHSTTYITETVYGSEHLGLARVAARVDDLRKEGHKVISRKKEGSIWEYRIENKIKEAAKNIASG